MGKEANGKKFAQGRSSTAKAAHKGAERLAKALLGDAYVEGSIPENIEESTLAQSLGFDSLVSDLGLPPGFFDDLLGDDDWSFVIKLHALLEAAMTHLLVKHFGEPELGAVFSLLEMSNLRTGKIAFADAASLIDTDLKRFIQKLSELRNSFVHDVSNVKTDLASFFKSLPASDLKGYRKGFLLGYQDGVRLTQEPQGYSLKVFFQILSKASFELLPRLALWAGGAYCLKVIYGQMSLSGNRRELKRIEEMMRSLLELNTEKTEEGEGERETDA